MKIGALARATGLSCDTLRFYEKLGLIRSTRADNGYRQYAPDTAQFIMVIRTAQKLGFTLAEIGGSMPAASRAQDPDAAVAALLVAKAKIIEERIVELERLKTELLRRVRQQCPMAPAFAAPA